MATDVDFSAAGLLDGLTGDAREQRLALLQSLHQQGNTLDELRTASAEGVLVFLGAEGQLGGSAEYTLEEVADQAGIDRDFWEQLLRASSVAVPVLGERTLGESDLELAHIAAQYERLGISREDQLEVTRVLAHGLGRAAETMRHLALKVAFEPGATESDLAAAFSSSVEELLPLVEPLLRAMMRQQLRNVARIEAFNAAERETGFLNDAHDVTVCFADLVGFTRVGEEVALDELGQIAAGLEHLVIDTIAPPTRLVKLLGDGVLLVSPDARGLLDSALALNARSEAAEAQIPQLRIGLSSGPALNRAADWFGRPVNLASRLTAIARPGSVIVSEDLHAKLKDDERYHWSSVGTRKIKGIREPVRIWRVRRADSD